MSEDILETANLESVRELKISDTFISHDDFVIKVQEYMQTLIIFKYERKR